MYLLCNRFVFLTTMKNSILILSLVLLIFACQNHNGNKVPDNVKGAYMYFSQDTYDGGKITEGDIIKHTFVIENRGKADLVIKNATGSCGCTVAKYEEKPIAPGKSAPIEVVFNSSGKSGAQHKTVTIVSNATPDTKVLTLQCEVLPNNKNKK
jgi:Protein of unknown function (DUF1573)